jgi:hypothetical protein
MGAWNQSGWYHVLAAGHNGANSPISATLQITIAPGQTVLDFGFDPPYFEPPTFISPTVRTLIVANPGRLRQLYRDDATDLMAKLRELAAAPEVQGQIVDLGSYQAISQTYQIWTNDIANPAQANIMAASIQALVNITRTAYPNLDSVVIVGDDRVVPFWRVPDEAALANEQSYAGQVAADPALHGALFERYFLSDDPYAGFNPLPWRGRGLTLPQYGIGRLVESPQEIARSIDAFLASPTISVTQGLVVGYDFLLDGATAMADALDPQQAFVERHIDNTWTGADLREWWLNNRRELSAINAHFTHALAFPPTNIDPIRADQIIARAALSGTLSYSVGCHSGLNIPGLPGEGGTTDFAQAILGSGGAWIGNTGYGYGDAADVGYSELLMEGFSQQLAAGETVGHALRRAKAEYFNRTGVHSFSPYDEKVLAQATLYGLPMAQVSLPEPLRRSLLADSAAVVSGQIGQAETSPEGLTARRVTFTPPYTAHAITPTATITNAIAGVYFSVGGEIESNPGEPIQPRTSVTITLAGETPHGAFFEGGTYKVLPAFDPVVARIISDVVDLPPAEPPFDFSGRWQPPTWSLINQLWTPEGVSQRLVVVPAQYRSASPTRGTERLFEQMDYTVYYSPSTDWIPPSIWRVQRTSLDRENDEVHVEVTDLSYVARVAVSYTAGDGDWRTVNLGRMRHDPNLWAGAIPHHPDMEWFVQVVDTAGNVAVDDNRGGYFGPAYRRWFPLVLHQT